jgi:Major Facilitator Superfamily
MVKRKHPLVPPSLFKSRNFTVTNISTFVIYGALYVFLTFQGLFLIGTLGYNEPAAGIAGLPATLFLVLFSTRFGKLAARYGPRFFMAAGPFVMGLGLLWLVRFPATSEPWVLGSGSILPPGGYFVDLLPSLLVFGAGLMMMVAPLTTALMTSVPKHNSGVASAINNAISRVGAPLVTALIFVAVVSSFYGAIGEKAPGVDTSSSAFRQEVAPLNVRKLVEEDADPQLIAAARSSSTDSFHLASLVAAALMFAGAAVNGFGIRNPKREPEPAAAGPPPRVDKIPEEVPCLPVPQPTAIPGDARMHAEPGNT